MELLQMNLACTHCHDRNWGKKLAAEPSARATATPTRRTASGGRASDRCNAAFFAALGYSADHWELLRDDLLALGRAGPAAPGKPSAFGRTFEVDGILTGPSGRSADVKTVWFVRANEDSPRFVTAFPR